MLRIRLFCANGMSTSLLVKKMEEAAKEKGKEVDIKAYPILDGERKGERSGYQSLSDPGYGAADLRG